MSTERALIHPIVLVGGKSVRFGRDKLREPLSGPHEWLVDCSVRALREVFGARVTLVGDCHPDVAARGDDHVADRYPAVGPGGGILTALEYTGGDVFVLAGDLPYVTASGVRAVLAAASAHETDATDATAPLVVLAESNGVHPCFGLYRYAVRGALADRLQIGRGSLYDLVPSTRRLLVPVTAVETTNLNTPD